MILDTARLIIRPARPTEDDVLFVHGLWTNPRVMQWVGFPMGLRVTPEEIRRHVASQSGPFLDAILLVEAKATGEVIGQCWMGSPDAEGIVETDVKLLPESWGRGFGTEVKRALVDFLFTTTTCRAVQATPNRHNIASQRMQEGVGGRRVGEGVHHFPASMRDFTVDVPFYVYQVTRTEWEAARRSR